MVSGFQNYVLLSFSGVYQVGINEYRNETELLTNVEHGVNCILTDSHEKFLKAVEHTQVEFSTLQACPRSCRVIYFLITFPPAFKSLKMNLFYLFLFNFAPF